MGNRNCVCARQTRPKTNKSALLLLCLLVSGLTQAATWYVDARRPNDSGDGLNWATAKKSIQAAVDESVAGDTILVKDGTYAPIVTNNKAISIQSVNGQEATIIDGFGEECCATLCHDYYYHDYDGPGYNTVLDGFTLQNGCAEFGGGVIGGTLINCTLKENSADYGGGACEARLSNCLLTGNEGFLSGGGGEACELDNCTLTGNYSYDLGGGVCGSTLNNCLVKANSAAGDGGGAGESFLTNCLLIGNYAGYGGGVSYSTLRNCTVGSNAAWRQGGGAYDCALANSIIWGNSAPKDDNFYVDFDNDDDYDDDDYELPGDDAGLVYCCASPLADGEGNIGAEPLFVDSANGDYRLRAGSPCVDAGNTANVVGDETDLAGNPRIGNGKVDMGAYEGVVPGFVISGRVTGYGEIIPRTAVVAAGESVTFQAVESGRSFLHFLLNGAIVAGAAKTYIWNNTQADGVITAVFENMTWYVDAGRPDDSGDGRSWVTAKRTIQAAVDNAVDGDLIEVADGEYHPVDTGNKAIAIRSVNGPEHTVITGGEYVRCATLSDGFTMHKTVLDGFTLQNGIMEKTVMTNNDGVLSEIYFFGDGGGARGGTLINCHLVNNSASYGGGAAYCTLINCTLTGNFASQGFDDLDEAGGGAYMCVLENCMLILNNANRSGGGAYDCLLSNCALAVNWSGADGGGAARSTLNNCRLTNNSAERNGGGVYSSSIINCTLVENSAGMSGGGIAVDCDRVANCIVWGNWAPEGENYVDLFPDSYSGPPFTFSCSDPLPAGEGNICADPLFVDTQTGDFRLAAESPCIDTGSNALAVGDVDLVGNPRVLYGVVDMGGDEFTNTSALSDGKYDWQGGWNTLYLPFDSLAHETCVGLAAMPVFRASGWTHVKVTEVPLHTPQWVFCTDPESAPVLHGSLTSGMPADPLAIPIGQWFMVGAQRRVSELPDGYVAWEWHAGRYNCRCALQPGHVYYIYRSNAE